MCFGSLSCITYNGASIVCSKMQILVAPLLEMPAQTLTFNACLATGLNGTSWSTFTRMVCQCLLSCTDDSSVQMMLSKLSWVSRHIFANSSLFCLFASEIMGPHLVFTTTHCRDARRCLRIAAELIINPNSRAINLWSLTKLSHRRPPAAAPCIQKF